LSRNFEEHQMSNEHLDFSNRTQKAALALSALVALGALTGLLAQPLAGGPAPSGTSHAEAAPAPPPMEPDRSAVDIGPMPPSRSPSVARPHGNDANSKLSAQVSRFLDEAVSYGHDDRAKVIDEALAKVVAGGSASVFEIQRQLDDTTVYEQGKRGAAFHALERIGKELVHATDPQSKRALAAIQSMVKSELALPSLIEPNPELDVDSLSAAARDELLHQGILVEHDGELMQPTALNKLPAIRVLRGIGGDTSHDQLEQLIALPDNAPGVQLAAQRALEVASR
jgi:hypothetical protein